MKESLEQQNLYERLNVAQDASAEEIKHSYRRLAIQHHPDKNPDDPHSSHRFKLIVEAYQVLSDADQRQVYDAYLKYGSLAEVLRQAREQQYRDYQAQQERYRQARPDRKIRPFPWRQFSFTMVGYFWFLVGIMAGHSYMAFSPSSYAYLQKDYHKSIRLDANSILPYKERGIYRFEVLGDTSGALSDLLHFYELESNAKAEVHYYIGRCYLAQEDFRNAYEYLRRATFKKPFNYSYIFWMGEMYRQLGHWTNAIAYFSRAEELRQDDARLYTGRAEALLAKRRFKEAMQDLDRALEIEDQPQLYFKKAQLYLAKGDSLEARDELLSALYRGHPQAKDLYDQINAPYLIVH